MFHPLSKHNQPIGQYSTAQIALGIAFIRQSKLSWGLPVRLFDCILFSGTPCSPQGGRSIQLSCD